MYDSLQNHTLKDKDTKMAQGSSTFSFAIDRMAAVRMLSVRSLGDVNVLDSYDNVKIAPEAGRALLSSARRNFMCGYRCGWRCETGSDNTMMGYTTGYTVVSGGSNSVLGSKAGLVLTGSSNVGIGAECMATLTTGTANTCVGESALSLTTGSRNVACGQTSMNQSTECDDCTCVGVGAGYAITTGSQHTCVGRNAGYTITTSDRCTAVGFEALGVSGGPAAANDDITAVGYRAGGQSWQKTGRENGGGATYVGHSCSTYTPVGITTNGDTCVGASAGAFFAAPSTSCSFYGGFSGYFSTAGNSDYLEGVVMLGWATGSYAVFGNRGGSGLSESAYTTGTYTGSGWEENQRIVLLGRSDTNQVAIPTNTVGIGVCDFNAAPFQAVLGGGGAAARGFGCVTMGFDAQDGAYQSTEISGYVGVGHFPYAVVIGDKAARRTFGQRSVIIGDNAMTCGTLNGPGGSDYYPGSGDDVFIGSNVASEVYGARSDFLVVDGFGNYPDLIQEGVGNYPVLSSVVIGADACSDASAPCVNFGYNVVVGAGANYTSSHSVVLGAGASNADARFLSNPEGSVVIGKDTASAHSAFTSGTLMIANGNTTSPLIEGVFDNATPANQTLTCAADVTVEGDCTVLGTLSDERVKRDIAPLDTDALAEAFDAIPFKSFDYTCFENRKGCYGVVAQDVIDVLQGKLVSLCSQKDLLKVDYTLMMTLWLATLQQTAHALLQPNTNTTQSV